MKTKGRSIKRKGETTKGKGRSGTSPKKGRGAISIDPVDPSLYCLFDNAVVSRAAELKPYGFVRDLIFPFVGVAEVREVKGQLTFNNGPDKYSPTVDIAATLDFGWAAIEMQTGPGFTPLRAFVYLINIVLAHIPKGAGLSRYYPKQGGNHFGTFLLLVFCNFHPFDGDERAVYRFDMRESHLNMPLGVDAEVIYIDCGSSHLTPEQRKVVHDLRAKKLEDMSIQSFRDALSYARGETTVVERRRTEIMTVEEYDEMRRAEGRVEGRAEGLVEGEAKKSAEYVRNIAECGFSNSEIARMLKLTENEVAELLRKEA